jgi:hypothetical protein
VHSEEQRPLLPLHANPDPCCPISARVRQVLSEAFGSAERALESALAKTTLAELLQGVAEPATPVKSGSSERHEVLVG